MRRSMIIGLSWLMLAGEARADDKMRAELEAYSKAIGLKSAESVFAPPNFASKAGYRIDVNTAGLLRQLGFASMSIDPTIFGITISGDRKSGLRIENAEASALTIHHRSRPDSELDVGAIRFSTVLREESSYSLRSHLTASNIRRPPNHSLGQSEFTIGAWQFTIRADATDKNTDRVRIETEALDFLEGWNHSGGRVRKASLEIGLGAVPHDDLLRYLTLLDPITRFFDAWSLNPVSPRLARARDVAIRLRLDDATIGMACPVVDRLDIGLKTADLSGAAPVTFDVRAASLSCPIDPFLLGLAGLYNDDMQFSATTLGLPIAEALAAGSATDVQGGDGVAVDDFVLRGTNRHGSMELRGVVKFPRGQFTPGSLDMVLTATGAPETLDAVERETRGKPEFDLFYATGYGYARALLKLGEADGAGRLRWTIAYAAGGKVMVNGHAMPNEMAIGSLLMMAVNIDDEPRGQADDEPKSALPKIE